MIVFYGREKFDEVGLGDIIDIVILFYGEVKVILINF